MTADGQNVQAVRPLEDKQLKSACTITVVHGKGQGKSSGLSALRSDQEDEGDSVTCSVTGMN